ncbi:hypothetical protein CBS101457_004527 [Exobasidium rhododendri]|nr:hypothetical protein CBS101457_004527 [Exobasidium rhododendri]
MSVTEHAPALQSLPPDVPSKDNGDPQVDFVIVFQGVPTKYLKTKEKAPASETSQIASEYQQILKQIQSVGLQSTTREGKPSSGKVLIFVRAPDELLIQRGREESLSDFLHDVKSSVEPASMSSLSRSSSMGKGAIKDQAQTFSSAERARHTYDLLTLSAPRGAGILVGSKEYPNVKSMSPLHDPIYNQAWLKRWANLSSALQINIKELDSIREHFGEHVALYFGFLNFYFQSLSSIAAVGLAFWAAGAPFHPVYSLLLVSWSLVFVELWRMKERKFAVRWGTSGVTNVDPRRKEFKPRITRKDAATGEDEEVFEWWRREFRIACSIPVMLFFAALLGAVLTTMFVVEVFVSKLYDGPGKALIPHIPMALFSICVPQIMGAWQKTAGSLTSWENHSSPRTHYSSMTLKMFALQALVSYGALTLSAFVYLPFGQDIMDHIVRSGLFADGIAEAQKRGELTFNKSGSIDFQVNPNRMHNQLFATLTTSQVIGAFTETMLPYILKKVSEYRESKQGKKETEKKPQDSFNSSFLARVREELELPIYDTFADFSEMSSQFGYVVLWSVLWPLAPVMAFVNNFFELRSDAFKVTINSRRPVPLRVESIGPWLEVLGFIAWLSSMFNAALVFLFSPSPEAHLPGHSVYETTFRTHLHDSGVTLSGNNGTASPGKIVNSILYPTDPAHSPRSPLSFSNLLPSSLPTSGATGALVAALLLALASEHIYGIALGGVRHILERALWKGSEEETILRRREWEQRQETLSHSGLANTALPGKSEKVGIQTESNDPFWSSSSVGGDVGLSVIQGSSKRE